MLLTPMLGDFASGTEPHAIMLLHVVEKLDQADRAGRTADQTIMEGNAHDLGRLGAFLVHQVETIDHVAREFIGGAEAIVLIESIVVCFVRIRYDKVMSSADFDPERKFVAEIVAIVEIAALLDQQSAG